VSTLAGVPDVFVMTKHISNTLRIQKSLAYQSV